MSGDGTGLLLSGEDQQKAKAEKGNGMPIENESDYTSGMENAIEEELAKHSTSGSEWMEIADYGAGEEPRPFTVKNWTGTS